MIKNITLFIKNFGISHGIVINKFDLAKSFCSKIEDFAKESKIPIIGKIPYRKDFVDSTIKMKPVVEINPWYRKMFEEIINRINIER
jgi:MinD superfamily P-loop ATPase